MAKPVRCRRSPATEPRPSGAGARSTSRSRCHPPRVKGNGITHGSPSHLLRIVPVLLLRLSGCAAPADEPPRPSDGARPLTRAVGDARDAEPYPVTLIDDAGRELVLEAEPSGSSALLPRTPRSSAPSTRATASSASPTSTTTPEVADVDKVVILATVDVELVVAAEPDLVLAAGNELTPTAVIEQLEQLGLPVLVLYPETLEEVYADIELLGNALDRDEQAADLAEDMEARVADVVAAVEGAETPRTLYEVFYAEGTTYTAGEGSSLASLIELAGAAPVTGDAKGVIGAEDLVAADPELILVGTASYEPSLADSRPPSRRWAREPAGRS